MSNPFTAHNGFTLPPVGLGTYAMNGQAGAELVTSAVNAGYRLLDTAFNYGNEAAVGVGARASEVDPAELIITTKLPGRHYERALATTSIEERRFRLGSR